jgi:hypothetical protein
VKNALKHLADNFHVELDKMSANKFGNPGKIESQGGDFFLCTMNASNTESSLHFHSEL